MPRSRARRIGRSSRPGPRTDLTLPDEDLVELARAGDELALGELLLRYRRFARAKARTYFLIGGERDDIVQEGMIGLYKAVRDFDPKHLASFRSFAELCINRQVLTAIKTATRQKHTPLNSYLSFDLPQDADEPDRTLGDVIAVESESDPLSIVVAGYDLFDLRERVDEVLSSLEAEVLELYVEGRSYQEIAELLNRHVKSIDNALQRIKRKLEVHLAEHAAFV